MDCGLQKYDTAWSDKSLLTLVYPEDGSIMFSETSVTVCIILGSVTEDRNIQN
jgi:hypothetical protein